MIMATLTIFMINPHLPDYQISNKIVVVVMSLRECMTELNIKKRNSNL